MKINSIALANAFAAVAFAAFAICMLWAAIDESSFISFWESWAHGFDLNLVATEEIGSFSPKVLFGLVSFTGSSWLTGYAIGWLYNKMSKEG